VFFESLWWKTAEKHFTTEYFARLRQADNEMKFAEIYNHVRLESGLVRRRDAGAQVPSLNGPLFVRSFNEDTLNTENTERFLNQDTTNPSHY
jgi:hypothetical protein